MPVATVLIPTHDHTECLGYSVASVLEQTVQDFELFIVGDGVSQQARDYIGALAAGDSRIRFFDFPKGERKGEHHRHAALMHASGHSVAYLGDDDIWMPHHLETLTALLRDADFGHTMHVGIGAQGEWGVLPCDLSRPDMRERMIADPPRNYFDFTFGGHSLAAYRRVEGWAPPHDCPWSDLFMWRQFLRAPWCRAKSAMVPTAICTQTNQRPNRSDRDRADELALLRRNLSSKPFRSALRNTIKASMEHANFECDVTPLNYNYGPWMSRIFYRARASLIGK